MDAVTGAVIIVGLKTVGAPAAGMVKELVGRALGPLADAVGDVIAHPVVRWHQERVDRGAKTVMDAARMSVEAGYEPHSVPGRILVPLLERASLEEEPELQRRWAALLANAAAPDEANAILPGYIEVLHQLTPIEARLLELMYDKRHPLSDDLGVDLWFEFHREDLRRQLNLTDEQFALLITDLHRLLLITNWRPSSWEGEDESDASQQYRRVRLTSFGLGFMEACRPPAKKNP